MPRFLRPLALLVLLLSAGACAVLEPEPIAQERAALARARDLWTRKRPPAYRYVYLPQCGECLPTVTRAVWVTVQGEKVTAVAYVDGLGPALTSPLGYPTVDGLFAVLDSAYARRAPSVRVRYDGTFGYPTEATIDGNVRYVDDEYGFAASALSAIGGR